MSLVDQLNGPFDRTWLILLQRAWQDAGVDRCSVCGDVALTNDRCPECNREETS